LLVVEEKGLFEEVCW